MITELNDRSREIFRLLMDAYMETGDPVGSRTLSKKLGGALSPATIRNVMADLEDLGLLSAPHTSAGRMPTEQGLRMFVDGLLEIGNLSKDERDVIESQCAAADRSMEGLLKEASTALSGLSHCAGLVVAPKADTPLKHIEFVSLNPGRALVILVMENGLVENRVIEVPRDLPPSALVEATNYLSSKMVGKTLSEAETIIKTELEDQRARLDALTQRVIEEGVATWAGDKSGGSLIIAGQSQLLNDVNAVKDLEHIRSLFQSLETKETVARLLSLTDEGEGVQIFIGSENNLFDLSGCSLVVAPYANTEERVLGAIGVIGPTRMSYARIIPMVDYTAKVIGRMIGQSEKTE